MSVSITQSIPRNKIEQFQDILKACGGRYLSNPVLIGGLVTVHYIYDDVHKLNEHESRWQRATTNIREVRKDQRWRKLLRRMGLSWAADLKTKEDK